MPSQSTHLAPEEVVRGALRVLHLAGASTRNWALDEGISRKQIYDLWEAVHDIPALLCRWHDGAERILLRYLDEYNEKWELPPLRVHYDHGAKRG